MASDTRNIEIGVARVSYKGVDLGLTKGGVTVSVETEMNTKRIDHFGSISIRDYIISRLVSVTVPMAEMTYANIASAIPGSSIILNGGAAATGSILHSNTLADGEFLTIEGKRFTYRQFPVLTNEIQLGATASETAANAAAVLSAQQTPSISRVNYSSSGASLLFEYIGFGEVGNEFKINSSNTNSVVSFMTGGVDPDGGVRVDLGIGTDTAKNAGELVLHPIDRLPNDTAQDITIPLAAASGSVGWNFDLDNVRVTSALFKAYPTTANHLLYIGNKEILSI